MPDFILDNLEVGDSLEPGMAGFSPRSARAVGHYLLPAPSQADLQTAIIEIVGSVSTAVSPNTRLNRILPIAHPIYPWLYASNVQTIRGVGAPSQANAGQALEAPTLPRCLFYPNYNFEIEYTPRPYAVLQDVTIPIVTLSQCFAVDGSLYNPTVPLEWWRYTDYDLLPHGETVKATRGMMAFRTSDNAAPGGPTTDKAYQFNDMPRLYLPNQVLKIIWYQVPFRYISSPNSYLQRFLGRVNQQAFVNWPAGSLLYINYNPIRYTPPVPQLNPWFGTFSTEKICDIEFTFIYTSRVGTRVPTPVNGNWIAAGHNLQPWFGDRNFYYGTTYDQTEGGNPNDPTKWTPLWLSFPLPLLFADPDTPNNVPANA